MGQMMELAQEYGLKVISDCAKSFGARYWGTCWSGSGLCQESMRQALLPVKLKGARVGVFQLLSCKFKL
jgi:dTDP-4-amino-4,6-dideoxygalactose transaminase